MSEGAIPAAHDGHPVDLIVTDDLVRSRLTVFFRLLLAIPHFVWVALWGFAAELALIVAWFAALFTGRVPLGLHRFMAGFICYSTRVTAYAFLLADPFPPFSDHGSYPVDARIAPPETQNRWTVFFRLVLAIAAYLVSWTFRLVNQIIAFLSWFYCLFTGRMHEGMRNLSVWLLRYEVQTWVYVFLLTGAYPSLSGAPSL
jgi:hypothetical protein